MWWLDINVQAMGLPCAQLRAQLYLTVCTEACSLFVTIHWHLASLQAMSMKTTPQRPLMWLHSNARALRARPTSKVAGALCDHGADHRLLHHLHELQLQGLPPQGGCLVPGWRPKGQCWPMRCHPACLVVPSPSSAPPVAESTCLQLSTCMHCP